MRKSLFISMLLCLFALVANAQKDVGIQGYYVCGSVRMDLKAVTTDPREFTEIGVPMGNNLTIYITEPQNADCTFKFDAWNSECRRLSMDGGNSITVSVPKQPVGSQVYCIIEVWCEGKYLKIHAWPY